MDNQSLADEHAVLSGIAKHGYDLFLDVSYLTSNTFTIDENQVIYKCYKKIFETDNDAAIDGSAVLSAANVMGYGNYFNNQQHAKHLRTIINTPVEASTTRKSASRIRKLEIARLLSHQLGQINVDLKKISGDESIVQILNMAEQPILDFSSLIDDGENSPVVLGDEVDDYLDYVEKNQNMSVGIPSGYPIYDEVIGGGFRRKNVSIIGARAKAGKTFFGVNVAYHVTSNEKIPVLLLDTEMAKEEQMPRILSRIAEKVKYKDIEKGTFLKNDFQKSLVHQAKEKFKKLPFHYLSIPGQPFEETLSVMRRWVRKEVGLDKQGRTKPCLIILDYFKVMDSKSISQAMSEFQLLGFMLTSMQAFAARFDVPILTFIQLNRDGLDKENEAAASGSDRITWFCSNFTIFKKKTQEEIAASGGPLCGNRKLVPVISRHGPGLDEGDYINMYANLDYATILEKATRNQTANQAPDDPGESGFDFSEDEPFDI